MKTPTQAKHDATLLHQRLKVAGYSTDEIAARMAQYWDEYDQERRDHRNQVRRRKAQTTGVTPAQKQREYRLKRQYGLEPSDVARMLDDQHHACPICQVPFTPRRAYVVDHHRGSVRGLLCVGCRDWLEDTDQETLARALRYLTGETQRDDW